MWRTASRAASRSLAAAASRVPAAAGGRAAPPAGRSRRHTPAGETPLPASARAAGSLAGRRPPPPPWRGSPPARGVPPRGRPLSAAADAAAAGDPPRESLDYDVVIVGAGPAGLAAAIRLRQLAAAAGRDDLSVCVLEKGDEVGAHILSGNVLEPRALDELLPTWREDGAPLGVPAADDYFMFLTETRALRLPTPPQMHNAGNYVLSLSALTRWLGGVAEEAGVDVFPGFAASELLLNDGSAVGPLSAAAAAAKGGKKRRGGFFGFGASGPPGGLGVRGVATADVGRAKDGSRKATFAAGTEIVGRLTLLAEGARGSLSEAAMAAFGLRDGCEPQTYALGIKEVWRLRDDADHVPGRVWHSVGYPLDGATYGGSFLYHMDDRRVALGFVTALDYANPSLSPYGKFQKWKAHPAVRPLLAGGEVLQYGARVLNEGGYQSVPRLAFPGGALIGCAAGFLNVPKIKGTHTAMKSGMLAAEAAFASLAAADGDAEAAAASADTEGAAPAAAAADGPPPPAPLSMDAYDAALRSSWVWGELKAVRNIRPGFHKGLLPGMANAALETYVTRGRAPWTLRHGRADHEATAPASAAPPLRYPKPDGEVTFDILTSVARSGTNHDHDAPAHLRLLDDNVPTAVNWARYGGPEATYCPAKVYEYVDVEADGDDAAAAAAVAAAAGAAEGAAVNDHTAAPTKALVINAQNCLHCKACDVKDVTQNIKWTVPERGGPKYTMT